MIRPIETIYNGYRFRSRLEARWAVFFDALGILYRYESEGFDLDGVWYLPDFYLPHQGYWIEIKPYSEDWPDHPMFDYLCKDNDNPNFDFPFFLIAGSPWLNPRAVRRNGTLFYNSYGPEAFDYNCYIVGDNNYRWCECPDCGYIGLAYDGRSDRLPCKECYYCAQIKSGQRNWRVFTDTAVDECPIHGRNYSNDGCPRHGGNLDKGYNDGTPRILAAYQKARQARF